MPLYQIRTVPDPCLREEAAIVRAVGPRERRILSRMAETMYSASGIGLAAPQVGIPEHFVVLDIGEGLVKLVNPQVISGEGQSELEEGCLSVPGVAIVINRPRRVTIQALDEHGGPIELEAEGLLSHVLQHEIDHLSGILIVDHGTEHQERMLS